MATIDERVDDLSGRVQKIEDKLSLTREEALKTEKNLSDLITKAVSEGNKEIKNALDKLDKRVLILENAEGAKALEEKNQFWKTARTTIIGVIITFFVTVLLNNLIIIVTSNDNSNKKEAYNEAYIKSY